MSDHAPIVDVEPPRLNAADAPPAHETEPHGPLDALPDEVHPMDYVKVIYKRRWIAVTVFLIVLLSAVGYTFTATPIFEARTRLMIEIADPNVVAFKEVIEEGQSNPDYYQTQYSILQSRVLARRAIDGLGLWNSPYLIAAEHTSFHIGALIAPIATLLREPPPASERPLEEPARQSRTINAFLANLTVEPIRNRCEIPFDEPRACRARGERGRHQLHRADA
jgi:succinoglycan biosynthesis transport protein ExoP